MVNFCNSCYTTLEDHEYWYCQSCADRIKIKDDLEEYIENNDLSKQVVCELCGKPYEINILENRYTNGLCWECFEDYLNNITN